MDTADDRIRSATLLIFIVFRMFFVSRESPIDIAEAAIKAHKAIIFIEKGSECPNTAAIIPLKRSGINGVEAIITALMLLCLTQTIVAVAINDHSA